SHFFFSSRRRHTRWPRDWSSDVCSSDLVGRPTRRGHQLILKNLKATKGLNCLNELMSASGGPTNVIGGFSIGLNPGLKVHEEGNAAYYGGGSAAGVVYVSIGDNQLLGGGNITSGNFGFGFPIRDATVAIDGKT